MTTTRLDLNHTEITKAKIRAALLGRKRSEETKAKIAAGRSIGIGVYDIKTGKTVEYVSIKQAAIDLKTSHTNIRNYIKTQKLFCNRYRINHLRKIS